VDLPARPSVKICVDMNRCAEQNMPNELISISATIREAGGRRPELAFTIADGIDTEMPERAWMWMHPPRLSFFWTSTTIS